MQSCQQFRTLPIGAEAFCVFRRDKNLAVKVNTRLLRSSTRVCVLMCGSLEEHDHHQP